MHFYISVWFWYFRTLCMCKGRRRPRVRCRVTVQSVFPIISLPTGTRHPALGLCHYGSRNVQHSEYVFRISRRNSAIPTRHLSVLSVFVFFLWCGVVHCLVLVSIIFRLHSGSLFVCGALFCSFLLYNTRNCPTQYCWRRLLGGIVLRKSYFSSVSLFFPSFGASSFSPFRKNSFLTRHFCIRLALHTCVNFQNEQVWQPK